jgi:orotate phosphoribosyltransferase
MNYGTEIAKKALEIKAIKLRPEDPFTWASGFRMPIYNDNRMFLFYPQCREVITSGFETLLGEEAIQWGIKGPVIAGTSTAGIPHATALANNLNLPLIYVRDKPKDHGLRNQIEGIDAESDLQSRKVVLIEDLISTGGSSAKAVQGIRDANGECNYCFSIFNYGLDKAQEMFLGKEPYDKEGNKLQTPCKVRSLLTYDTLLEVAKEVGYIDGPKAKMLAEWREDPFGWGEKHGFPKAK